MAKHKAPTQVTILREEKSIFMTTVDRFWKPVALITVVLSSLLLYSIWTDQQAAAGAGLEWVPLDDAIREVNLEAITLVREQNKGTKIEPWALLAEGQAALNNGEEALAQEAFASLSTTNDPVLSKLELPIGPDGSLSTIAAHLTLAANAQATWNAENPILSNPDPAGGMPKIVFETDLGEIEVSLYMDRAPIHSKNMVKLASEGFYDGTLFHRVVNVPSMWIVQGGDPNSIEGDPSTWGQGGPGYSQTPEKNGLVHARGFVSAASPSAGSQSSGSQFFFTLSPCHHLDGGHTVFGQITSGLSIVEEIGKGEIRAPIGGSSDIPVEPIKVIGTTVSGA